LQSLVCPFTHFSGFMLCKFRPELIDPAVE
jgi:hypothetical protein